MNFHQTRNKYTNILYLLGKKSYTQEDTYAQGLYACLGDLYFKIGRIGHFELRDDESKNKINKNKNKNNFYLFKDASTNKHEEANLGPMFTEVEFEDSRRATRAYWTLKDYPIFVEDRITEVYFSNSSFIQSIYSSLYPYTLQSVSLLRHKLSTKFKAQKKSQIKAQNSNSNLCSPSGYKNFSGYKLNHPEVSSPRNRGPVGYNPQNKGIGVDYEYPEYQQSGCRRPNSQVTRREMDRRNPQINNKRNPPRNQREKKGTKEIKKRTENINKDKNKEKNKLKNIEKNQNDETNKEIETNPDLKLDQIEIKTTLCGGMSNPKGDNTLLLTSNLEENTLVKGQNSDNKEKHKKELEKEKEKEKSNYIYSTEDNTESGYSESSSETSSNSNSESSTESDSDTEIYPDYKKYEEKMDKLKELEKEILSKSHSKEENIQIKVNQKTGKFHSLKCLKCRNTS
ncbi:hypothetical protein M0812_16420 [Anaeramoeba flamelloides]|uniref:Uncharacterized protein n=1 Tax=Anaeramoeba flamelloides TaxID=1746091 RepID=A0AAV7ZI06_9EUKA|nr:hypothetical protein M0812_16420 [Anaeramoeba flamelloides]